MTKIETTLERIRGVLAAGKAKAGSVAQELHLEESVVLAVLEKQVKLRKFKRSRRQFYSLQDPVEKQVTVAATPASAPLPEPEKAKRILANLEMTTKDFADLIIGQTLTYRQMRKIIEQRFDGFTLDPTDIRLKIRTLMVSPHVDIKRINGVEFSYHLISVGSEFVRCSSRTKPVGKPKPTGRQRRPGYHDEEQIIRTGRFDKKELECCHITEIFNGLLMPVRRRFEAQAGGQA